jgi:hypothetical protein
MSTDYATGKSCFKANVAQSFIANATKLIPGSYIVSQYDFLAIEILARINTAPTLASQTVKLQASDAAGSFTSPTDLATITFLSSHTAGRVLQARVPESLAFISVSGSRSPGVDGARRALRLVHTAGGTDATLDYDVEVFTTSRHE